MRCFSSPVFRRAGVFSTVVYHRVADVHVADDVAVDGDVLTNDKPGIQKKKHSLIPQYLWKCNTEQTVFKLGGAAPSLFIIKKIKAGWFINVIWKEKYQKFNNCIIIINGKSEIRLCWNYLPKFLVFWFIIHDMFLAADFNLDIWISRFNYKRR